MKTKMQESSLMAFSFIKVQPREKAVIATIRKIQPCNDEEISRHLGWPINRVTGRRNSLAKKGLITCIGKKKNRYNRKVMIWRAVS